MKSAKEVTIDYLKSIINEKRNILNTCDLTDRPSVIATLSLEIGTLERAIQIVD